MANPEVIISNSDVFQIVRPKKGDVINIQIRQGEDAKTIISDIVSLTNSEVDQLKRLRAMAGFSKTVQRYISAGLTTTADRLVGGSEDISAAARYMDSGALFNQRVLELKDMGLAQQEIEKLIMRAGGQIRIGETHMGEMPQPVAEHVTNLCRRVGKIFNQ